MRKLILSLVLTVLFVSLAVADPRGPSTPEERQRALTIAHKLESNPLDPSLKQDREWVFQWLKEVPDVRMSFCTDIVKPLLNKPNSQARNAYLLQNILGNLTYTIENPDSKDRFKANMAGVNSMLRAYDNALKVDPTKMSPFLNNLRQKRDSGKLETYVNENLRSCSKRPGVLLTP